MSWNTVKLGDLLKRRKTAVKIIPDKDYKLVTIKLHHKGVVLRNIVKGYQIKSSMHEIKAGDFILSGIDARNGAFGIVPNELEGAIVTNDFWCLEPDKDIIGKEFLLFLSKTEFFDQICRLSSDGTTQRIRLQKDKFYNYEVALPRLDEQRTILSKLNNQKTNSDTLTTELTRQLDLVKQLRQSFLREAMQGKLVEQDPNDEPASELLGKIKATLRQAQGDTKNKKQKELPPIKEDEIPFVIPDNWAWCRLGEFCDIKGGKRVPAGYQLLKTPTSHVYIRVSDMKNGTIDDADLHYIEDEIYQQLKQYTISKDDIYMTIVGATIGKCGVVPEIFHNMNLTENAVKITPLVIDKKFLYFLLNVPFAQEQFIEKTKKVGVEKMAIFRFKNTILPLPPLPEQHRIVAKLEQLMQLCDDLEQSIRQGKEQTNMLLQAALREALQPGEGVLIR